MNKPVVMLALGTLLLHACGGGSRPAAPCTTYEGDLTIRNANDWNALVAGGCTSITGTLVIGSGELTGSLTAPDHLVSLGYAGTWTISGNETTATCLP